MRADDFFQRYDAGENQLVVRRLPADIDTPVSVALKLLAQEPYSFVLESVEGGETRGRYSFLGWAPDLLWRCNGTSAEVAKLSAGSSGQNPIFEAQPQQPLHSLQQMVKEATIPNTELGGIPAPGLVGYLGYDMVRHVERLPNKPTDCLGMPDALLMRPTMIAVFDTVTDELAIAAVVRPKDDHSAKQALGLAQANLQNTITALTKEIPRQAFVSPKDTPQDVRVNVPRDVFCENVLKAKDLIAAGDIFQVVLSRRFDMDFKADSFELYRALRRVNPAPFLFHLKLGDASLIGSSPEILVRARGGKVTVRPIAGTRPRGANPDEDLQFETDLLSDKKECAEHLMLLDLGRNDVGRIAKPGSVRVTSAYGIERYSHVMHLVSNVEGDLATDETVTSALFAGFPAGTVSGAPKVRAMEIIDELETDARGPYAGAVGYFGTNGDLDSCIVLRTAIVKGGKVYIQAGAGIVADSDPLAEALECEQKAAAMIAAVRAIV